MSDTPVVAWANTRAEEAWRCYVDGSIAVRQLNSGVVQIKTGEETEWRDA